MKAGLLFGLLVIGFVVACGAKAPPAGDVQVTEQGLQDSGIDLQRIDQDLAELDQIEKDLDFSDLDTLNQDLDLV